MQLLNVKSVTERRENMLWFRIPPKVYFKNGCLEPALKDLKVWAGTPGNARVQRVCIHSGGRTWDVTRLGTQAPGPLSHVKEANVFLSRAA